LSTNGSREEGNVGCIRNTVVLACLVALEGLTFACQRKSAGTPVEGAPRFIGRFVREADGAQRFAWGMSTIEARFEGTEAALLLEDVETRQGENMGNVYDVIVDDGPPKVVQMHNGISRYPLGRFKSGEHTLSIIKRTEAWVGEARFRGLDLGPSGKLLPPPPERKRRLEFIGDSISAGYGNEGTSEKCPFSPQTENGDLAFGPMTARALEADALVIAFSGKGVIRNRDGTTQEVLPEIYTRALPHQPDSVWDFSKFVPDAVVVNLGTNDFAMSVPNADAFKSAYTKFLTSVRQNYPKAHIFVGIGPMLSEMYSDKQTPMLAIARADIQEVVARRVASGDTLITALEFPRQTGNRGYGCDWHPSLATHAEMAQQLTPLIKATLGW